MENLKYRFVIVGAGVSGLTTAYELSKACPGGVLVLEKDSQVGGLCKTINFNDAFYDLGSHRIHWNSRRSPFELIKNICMGSLLRNIRKGKLRIKESYIVYPIKSIQFLLGIGFIESFLCALSLFKNMASHQFFRKNIRSEELNYESHISSKAGYRTYKLFYEPYARKVWGLSPNLISIDAVKKRISMTKPTRFLRYAFANYFTGRERNFFYYIEGGIGRFAEGLKEKVIDNGGKAITSVGDFSIKIGSGSKSVAFCSDGKEFNVEFDKLISTIPMEDMAVKLSSEADVRKAACKIKWRGLKLVYLHIKGEPGVEGETFYFPELKYVFGRVSVPKRFSGRMQPENGYTCVTCEIPCSENDNLWNMPEKEVYDLCLNDLRKAELITEEQDYLPGNNFIVNIPKVYPVYVVGWKSVFWRLLNYLGDKFPDIYLSGRPGFFMHCNLDHAIDIGLSLAKHIMEEKSAKEWYSKAGFFQNMKLRD